MSMWMRYCCKTIHHNALEISVKSVVDHVHGHVQVAFDPNNWIDRGTALVAGAGVASAAWALWPYVRNQHNSQATLGAVAGSLATALSAAVAGGLCLATPYCMMPSG